MEGMFSGLEQAQAEIEPSPVLLPDIRFEFKTQIDPSNGDVMGYYLLLWLTSLPIVKVAIPFDRLSFAGFIKAAQSTTSGEGVSGNGGG